MVKQKRVTRRRRQRGGAVAPATSPFFTDAYAVTIDPESKRFKDIKAYADAAGLPLQPWKGVVIKPEEKDTLPPLGIGTTNFKDRTGAVFNLGVIGAYLGHRNLYQHIADTAADKPGTMIYEDDVEIPPDLYSRLSQIQDQVPADWDFIFLDKLYVVGKKISDNIMKLDKDMTGYKNWGIWGYIVKNASLKDKVLPIMKHMMDVPDIQLAKFADVLNMYLIVPSIVKQDAKNAPNSVVTVLDSKARNLSSL